jgi:DNA polymerase
VNLNLDFETRSECDLKMAGAYVYARHPSTVVLCAGYSIDDGPVTYWAAAAGLPMPDDLRAALDNPRCLIHAWNSQFERLIITHTLKLDLGIKRFHCTAAWARSRGLPGKLEAALQFIDQQVDPETNLLKDSDERSSQLALKRRGKQIMLKWCKPLATGGWANDPDEYMELIRYCMGDVESEQKIAGILAADPMREQELIDFFLNEQINDRGLPVDTSLAIAAGAYGAEEKAELSAELSDLTMGVITSTSQHARIKECLGHLLSDEVFKRFFVKTVKGKTGALEEKASTDKRNRSDFLLSPEADENPEAADLIKLVDDAGRASVSKYAKMAARAADNGRAEGSYLFAGAGQTKRYSSQGIQVHNMPRAVPKDVPAAVQMVLARTIPAGTVMSHLSSLLRPTLMSDSGQQIIWGDWSSVEARGMPWMAQCQWKLDLYRKGVDVYKVNATDIFGIGMDKVTDAQRQIGKVAELSLQFGGARGALKSMARNYGIGLTDMEADKVVDRWRGANKWAADFSQGLLNAFCGAVLFEGATVSHGGVGYQAVRSHKDTGLTMRCTLPGGTVLYYQRLRANVFLRAGKTFREARVIAGVSRGLPIHGDEVLHHYTKQMGFKWACNAAFQLSVPPWVEEAYAKNADNNPWRAADNTPMTRGNPYMMFSKAMTSSGRDERVWSGLLAENSTQALCAALLRDCLLRVDAAYGKTSMGAYVIGHTHDEVIAEATDGDVARAKKILLREMCRVPEWLPGFPLGAEIKSGQRYGK